MGALDGAGVATAIHPAAESGSLRCIESGNDLTSRKTDSKIYDNLIAPYVALLSREVEGPALRNLGNLGTRCELQGANSVRQMVLEDERAALIRSKSCCPSRELRKGIFVKRSFVDDQHLHERPTLPFLFRIGH